jgi:hypothetical protein
MQVLSDPQAVAMVRLLEGPAPIGSPRFVHSVHMKQYDQDGRNILRTVARSLEAKGLVSIYHPDRRGPRYAKLVPQRKCGRKHKYIRWEGSHHVCVSCGKVVVRDPNN